MKMREKSKLESVEEIPLVELERQIRDEGELSFDSNYVENLMPSINL